MKKIKTLIVIIASVLALLVPFITLVSLAFNVKGVYSHSFTAALADKYELLYSTSGRKIVVVGGSSVCFGLDSKLLEGETGRKVVDFGLYATLGTKVMLDLSERGINSGDTVIIAPELDPQTMSSYFNQETVLEAIDGHYSMLRDIGNDNYDELAGGFLTYISTALGMKRNGIEPDPKGVYNRSSFNSRGDIAYKREGNVMTLGYDANRLVDLSPEILSEDFIEYMNGYIDRCLAKGADVWFSFCPINKSGLEPGTTDESIYEFYTCLSEKLHCRVISDINDYILDQGYFYDTNFHLNDVGVKLRTQTLARDLLRAEGNNRHVEIETGTPGSEGSETPPPDMEDNTDGTFVYRYFGKTLAVEGVAESARGMTSADVPREFNGIPVNAILEGAFKGCDSLTEITIHDNITFIANKAFEIPSLRKLYIDAHDAEVMEAGNNIFGGNAAVEIILPDNESYASFVTGYWWSVYGGRFKVE
ncbi:MAG: leucine-rich repeat domain-containing protein [Clostridia bacterium]|nr:leucine-rich repeat domain-containing protein [Clostridia bacterium]